MNAVRFIWNCIIAITIYTVFKENPLLKNILITIIENLGLLIKFLSDKIQ